MGFNHQDIWGGLGLIDLDCRQNAPKLNCDMGLGHAPVHRGSLQRLSGLLVVAKRVDVDAGHQCYWKLISLRRCVALGSCVDHFFDPF